MTQFKKNNNEGIRLRMSTASLHVWQLAEAVGVSENTMYRWLRHDLTGWRLDKVLEALTAMGA